MNIFLSYFRAHQVRLLCAFAILVGMLLGAIDPATASLGVLVIGDTQAMDEILKKALAEHGVNLKTFAENFKASLKEHGDELGALRRQIVELAQKGSHVPIIGGGGGTGAAEVARMICESPQVKQFLDGNSPSVQVQIPRHLWKTAVISSTNIVMADRRPGIAAPPEARPTVRELFAEIPVTSSPVEFPQEATFTNNAGPQGGPTSPVGSGEGEAKPESAFTFTLGSEAIRTIAHFVPASRQVLSDAAYLQSYLERRLLYGLANEIEDELLDGSGAAGELNGLVTQQTSFTGGSTNLTSIDALALAVGQLAASDYLCSAFVVNPSDWYSSKFITAKDSNGQYLLGAPGSMAAPTLWGIPVALSTKLGATTFLAIDTRQAGFIAARETATVRISEHHSDFFTRNLVAILAEERLALIIERTGAVVGGSLSYTG